MYKIALFIFVSILVACGEPKKIEEFYDGWLSENIEALDKIEQITLNDSSFEKIWTVGNAVRFSIVKDGNVQDVQLPENHELFTLLPKHSNMLYLVNDSGVFVGVGGGSVCGGFNCTIGIAKFRSSVERECKDISHKSEGLVCVSPLKGEWYLRYHYLGKTSENT